MRKLAATVCLTIAVLLGSVGVSWSGDFQKGVTAYKNGDCATALREFQPLAEQGDDDAQFYLGMFYDDGYCVPESSETAMKWYRLAAERGHSGAQEIMNTYVPWWEFWEFYGWWRVW